MKHLLKFLATVLLLTSLHAQQFDNPTSISVSYFGSAVCGGYYPSLSFGSELGAAASANPSVPPGTTFFTNVAVAHIVPGKTYNVSVVSNVCGYVKVYFPSVAGFNIYLNGELASSFAPSGNTVFKLRVEPVTDPSSVLEGKRGGACISFPDDKPIWAIGLGSLRYGKSAGHFGFRADSISSALFDPTRMEYDSVDSGEVSVERTDSRGDYITKIISRDVTICLDGYNPGDSFYRYKVYQSANLTTPFITYTIKPYSDGNGSNGIQIDKLEDNITWSTVLQETSSGWLKYDWRVNTGTFSTDNPITTTISGATSTTTYGQVDSQSSSTQLTRQKTFTTLDGHQELSTSSYGPALSTGQTTQYFYYSEVIAGSWSNALKTRIDPSGNWVTYQYYNASGDLRSGLIHYIYRPWLDSPTSPSSATLTNCYLETYDYTTNHDGSRSAPLSKVTTVNGTTVAKTDWQYNWSFATVNNHSIAQTLEDVYSSSSQTLRTTTLSYKLSDSVKALRGRPHAVTKPDGTKDSYAYYFGTWNASTNSFSPDATGNDSLVLAFHGQAASGPNTSLISTWTVGSTPWTIDSLYLVSGLSTVTETVVDTNGHTVFTAENIYNGSGLERISASAFTFNGNNLISNQKDLIRSVATTGGDVSVSYTYSAGLPTSKTEVDGTVTSWGYDAYLRNTSITTAYGASGYYPSTTQSFTYYSSNLKETGQETARGATVTSYRYDQAGRLVESSQPKPGGGTLSTSVAYPSLLQVVTTLPTQATKQTTVYLDGKLKEQSGTAQAATFFDYSIDASTGNVLETKRFDSNLTNGWSKNTKDWLGRLVTNRTPQWAWSNSASDKVLRKSYDYNASGQLSRVSTTDEASSSARLLPDHLYEYGNLGLVAQEGDDIDNNGQLDAASTDRILAYTKYFYKDTSAYNGWILVEETQTYKTLNSAADFPAISQRNTRFTGFNAGGMLGAARVLSDVVTIDASGRYKAEWEWADASARTRTRYSSQQGASEPSFVYWQDAYLKSEQSASGVTTTYSYDSQGRVTNIVSGSTQAATSYGYHAYTDFLESESSTTGQNSSVSRSYVYTWDSTRNSSTVAVTDAANNVSYTESNAFGLPWHTWGGASQPSQIDYDSLGRRTSITTWQGGSPWTASTWPSNPGAGNVVTWNLDPASGLANSKVFPDASSMSFTYNARGQLGTRTWARTVVTTYSYFDTSGSQTGELSGISYSDGTPSVSFTYTRTGALGTVSDAAGTRMIAYGADLKPTAESYDSSFYAGNTLSLSYDSMGRSTGYSFQGNTTVGETIGYDSATGRCNGYVGSLGQVTASFTPSYAAGTDWVSGVSSGSYSRSLPLVSRRDVIASATTSWNGTALASFTASYSDARAWRNGQSGASGAWTNALSLAGAINSAYSLDGFGQLSSSAATVNGTSRPTHSYSWSYDLSGNRTYESGAVSTTYSAGTLNQYTSIIGSPLGESALSYDADGNMTLDGTWSYAYDGENRISGMTRAGQSLSFKYDYLGRRIQKTVTGSGASDTKYLWQGWKLVAELASNGSTINKAFVWGPDFSDEHGAAGGAGALLAQIDGGTISYAVPDVLGNIVGYVSTAGSIVGAVEYSPYGRAVTTALAYQAFPFGYSGQYTDWETGLVYYGHRYYNPKHGRFINRDPAEEQGGYNLYAFCYNRPTSAWDVLGRETQSSGSSWFSKFLNGVGSFFGSDGAGEGQTTGNAQNLIGDGLSGQDAEGRGGAPVELPPFQVTSPEASSDGGGETQHKFLGPLSRERDQIGGAANTANRQGVNSAVFAAHQEAKNRLLKLKRTGGVEWSILIKKIVVKGKIIYILSDPIKGEEGSVGPNALRQFQNDESVVGISHLHTAAPQLSAYDFIAAIYFGKDISSVYNDSGELYINPVGVDGASRSTYALGWQDALEADTRTWKNTIETRFDNRPVAGTSVFFAQGTLIDF